MANRIALPVLGGTLAPYGSHAPIMQTGNVSEAWHFTVEQLERGVDTSAAIRAVYPNALSYINVVNTYSTVSKHSKAQRLYLNINAAAVDTLTS